MSIYATVAEIAVRLFGDDEFHEIYVQAVPPHIVHDGPEWGFLPPPVDPDGPLYRAVVFVEETGEKGTDMCGQEYIDPLLVLTGAEYEAIRFIDLNRRLEEALEERYGPQPKIIMVDRDGNMTRGY